MRSTIANLKWKQPTTLEPLDPEYDDELLAYWAYVERRLPEIRVRRAS